MHRFAESIEVLDLDAIIGGGRPDPREPLRLEIATIKNKMVENEAMIQNLLELAEAGAFKSVGERLALREVDRARFEESLRMTTAKLAEMEAYRGNFQRNLTGIRHALKVLEDDAAASVRIKVNKLLHSLISYITVHLGEPRMCLVVFKEGYSTVILGEPWALSNGVMIGAVTSDFSEADFPGKIYEGMLADRSKFEQMPSQAEREARQREWEYSPEAKRQKQQWAEEWEAILAEAEREA